MAIRMSIHKKLAAYRVGNVQKTVESVTVKVGRSISTINRALGVQMTFDDMKL